MAVDGFKSCIASRRVIYPWNNWTIFLRKEFFITTSVLGYMEIVTVMLKLFSQSDDWMAIIGGISKPWNAEDNAY